MNSAESIALSGPFARKARRRVVQMAGFVAMALAALAGWGCPGGVRPVGSKSDVRAPGVEILSVGLTVEGRAIQAWSWNQGEGRPVLIIAAIHGDERLAGELGERLLRRWQKRGEDLGKVWVVLVPIANPDGWERDTRGNARGVDLNRNFPTEWEPSEPGSRHYGGPEAWSEPETRALAALIEGLKPSRIVSIHSPLHGVNYDGPAEDLALAMSEANGYPLLPDLGYPTPGSLGSYAGGALGIPTITLELPKHGLAEIVWQANYPAILTAVHYQEESGSGAGQEGFR